MSSIADFEFNQSPLSEGVILVSQRVRSDFSALNVRKKLQQLVYEARKAIPRDLDQDQQLDMLLMLFTTHGDLAVPVVFTVYPMRCG